MNIYTKLLAVLFTIAAGTTLLVAPNKTSALMITVIMGIYTVARIITVKGWK